MSVRIGLLVLLVLVINWSCDARNLVSTDVSGVEKTGNVDLCFLCEEYASLAIEYLNNNKTQTEVIEALHIACHKMHGLKDQCIMLVDQYAPMLFLEVSSVDPEGFCKKVGLCQKVVSYSSSEKQSKCENCHQAVDELLAKLKDPDTELGIIAALLKVCDSVENYKMKCKSMVFQYGPILLVDTEKFIEQVDLCTAFHACPNSKTNPLIDFDGKIEMRKDRSVDFDDLLKRHKYVSRLDLEKLRDTLFDSEDFNYEVYALNEKNKFCTTKGRCHFEAASLADVLSAQILPHNVDLNKPIAIYGRIYIEFYHVRDGHTIVHDLFNREYHDPEILDLSNPYLSLDFPFEEYHFEPPDAIPVQETKIIVDLWDAHEKIEFARDTFLLEDVSLDEYEQVNMKVIRGTRGSLAVRYFSMLFGIHCLMDVLFYQRLGDSTRPVLNVYGEIVARYGNTHGNYVDEGCTLFRRLPHEFERLEISTPESISLSKSWLSLPAYSSIIIDFDLFDFDTKAPIFKGAVELVPDYECNTEAIEVNDFVMMVYASWYSRIPDLCRLVSDDEDEDEEEEEEGYVERNNPWYHHTRVPGLFDSAAIEVFTIFIGRDKMLKSVKLFGTIQLTARGDSFYIFRRDNEEDAFELSQHTNFLPILNASTYISDVLHSVEMKFDLKDVDGNLFIKGFIKWCSYTLRRGPSLHDTQLCSVIPGEHGFAAVHYTIFEWALVTNIEATYKLNKGGFYAVYGSLIAEYDTYDYSTSFKKDCYRVVLFERVEQDMLTLGIDGKIPLSRSTVVVPADSTVLIIEANIKVIDLSTGVTRQDLSQHLEIKAGMESASVETQVCTIDFCFKWKPL